MGKRENIALIGLITSTILILFGIFVLLQGYEDNKEDIPNEQNDIPYITTSDEESKISFKQELAGIKPNIKPQFNVGEKFIYKDYSVTDININSKKTYEIKGTERVDNSEYYIIELNEEGSMRVPYTVEARNYTNTLITYVNKETGELRIKDGDKLIPNKMVYVQGNFMYAYWMLAIKEDITFEISNNISFEDNAIEYIYNFKVIGIENIGNRKCFNVQIEMVVNDGKKKQILEKYLYWVDVEKRILIKGKRFEGNLATDEINLVSEL